MDSLISLARRAPTPRFAPGGGDLPRLLKQAHRLIIRGALGTAPAETGDAREVAVGLRRYALWLERQALAADPPSEDLCALAAHCYEFAATLSGGDGPTTIFAAPLNDLLRAAILSSLTAYQAQASLLGGRVRERLVEGVEPQDVVARCHRTVAAAVAALVGRQLLRALDLGATLAAIVPEVERDLDSSAASPAEILAIDRALAIGLACGRAAAGLISGDASLIDDALLTLRQGASLALESGDAAHHWLADRLALALQHQADGNIHRLLDAPWLARYRRQLAGEGMVEFWGPQREALRLGLLTSGQHLVAALPTGSGKTLLGELALLAGLPPGERGWGLYITPSRALANQVSGALRRRLRGSGVAVRTILAGAEPGLGGEDELQLLAAARTVTVTTPEKVDAYYRNRPELFATCRVAVVDEAHKIGDPGRGALLESLLARWLVQHPGLRLVLLSGVLGNADELVEWLGRERSVLVAERRRATRQVRALLVRQDDATPRAPGPRAPDLRRVDYSAGLLLVHESDDLAAAREVDVPDVIVGFYSERRPSASGRWREDRTADYSNTPALAKALAEALAPGYGTVLVFMQQIRSVEKAIERRPPARDDPPGRRRLADFLALELGAAHPLVAAAREGVAYHHAKLPVGVQRAVELGLERGWLRVVFATPTLREGLNTTATAVVIAGHSYPEGKTRRDIEVADLLNLAGRAGRPGVDTEGLAILVPEQLPNALQVGRRYLLAGEEQMRASSQLAALADALATEPGEMTALARPQQALLLALEAAGLADEAHLEEFFARTLWHTQRPSRPLRGIAAAGARVTAAARDADPLRFATIARLGLSYGTADALYARMDREVDQFAMGEETEERRATQLALLLDAALGAPELQQGYLQDNRADAHLPFLRRWLAGDDYAGLATAGAASGIFKAASINEAVKCGGDYSVWLTWGLGAAVSILRVLAPDLDPWVEQLPLRARYGVPDLVAAYLALLGVADRTAAQRLARAFDETGEFATLAAVQAWVGRQGGNLDRFFPESEHALRAELLRRQLFPERAAPLPYRRLRFTAGSPLAPGTFVVVRDDGPSVAMLGADSQVLGTARVDRVIRAFIGLAIGRLRGLILTVDGRGGGELLIIQAVDGAR